jgi:hypothetical protein
MTGRKHGHSFNGSRKGKNTMWKSTDAFYTVINSLVIPVEIIAKSPIAPTLTVLVTEDTGPWKKGEKLHVNTYDVKKFDEYVERRSEDEIHEQLWEDDDSAETDEENREWYRQRASGFEFHPMMTICGYCNEREACYNGITQAVYNVIDEEAINGVIFQFCKICCDELLMIKLQTKVSRERIGA